MSRHSCPTEEAPARPCACLFFSTFLLPLAHRAIALPSSGAVSLAKLAPSLLPSACLVANAAWRSSTNALDRLRSSSARRVFFSCPSPAAAADPPQRDARLCDSRKLRPGREPFPRPNANANAGSWRQAPRRPPRELRRTGLRQAEAKAAYGSREGREAARIRAGEDSCSCSCSCFACPRGGSGSGSGSGGCPRSHGGCRREGR